MINEVIYRNKERETSNVLKIDVTAFNSIVRTVNMVEEEVKGMMRRKNSCDRNQDTEGTQAMIQQLEYLLKKKEARIKELNNELEENFNDKEELEIQIQGLEERNMELEENVKMLEEQYNQVQS